MDSDIDYSKLACNSDVFAALLYEALTHQKATTIVGQMDTDGDSPHDLQVSSRV